MMDQAIEAIAIDSHGSPLETIEIDESAEDRAFNPHSSQRNLLIPSPPLTPSADLGIRFRIYKLQEQVELLEQIISEPQIIAVTGIQNLRTETGRAWKDRVLALLFDACIPYFWTIDIVPEDDNHVNPDLAYIYFINHQTKNEAVKLLHSFLMTHYDNQVYIS